VSAEATKTARAIVKLREDVREEIGERLGRRTARAHEVLDGLFRKPVVTVKDIQKMTGLSQPASNALVNELTRVKILVELTGHLRNRVFMFDRYLSLFRERSQRG
jgi:Fic family protein